MMRNLFGVVSLCCLSLASMGVYADALDCNGCIDTPDIGKKQVTKKRLAKKAVDSSRVKNNSLKGKDIKDDTLTEDDLGPGSVGTSELQSEAVTAAKLEPAVLADLPSQICPAGAPTRFADNGDGTICDHQTGLMWEKKDSLGGGPDLANPHDADNTYTWSSASSPDGTAFTDFLVRLNTATDDPSMVGFAGYTDWRLPTIVELQTILLEPSPCSISPCIIDPVFAPTAAVNYWSSTSHAGSPGNAWGVGFSSGAVSIVGKIHGLYVRAVRGGR